MTATVITDPITGEALDSVDKVIFCGVDINPPPKSYEQQTGIYLYYFLPKAVITNTPKNPRINDYPRMA